MGFDVSRDETSKGRLIQKINDACFCLILGSIIYSNIKLNIEFALK